MARLALATVGKDDGSDGSGDPRIDHYFVHTSKLIVEGVKNFLATLPNIDRQRLETFQQDDQTFHAVHFTSIKDTAIRIQDRLEVLADDYENSQSIATRTIIASGLISPSKSGAPIRIGPLPKEERADALALCETDPEKTAKLYGPLKLEHAKIHRRDDLTVYGTPIRKVREMPLARPSGRSGLLQFSGPS